MVIILKPQRLFEIFTEALENESIKAEMIDIIGRKTSEGYIDGQTELFPRSDTSALSAENAALSRRIALLELEIGRLQSENAALSAQNKRCNEALNTYCSSYAMQIALYEKYRTLSESTMKTINGFFKNNTLSGIFICGVQHDNLQGLRNYTEQLVINSYNEKRNDIAVLNDLYTYLLSCYNSTFSAPVYRLTDVKPGDEYDGRIHHNTGTAKSGRISSVLMQGCISTVNSKIVRKAIVTL